MESIKDKLRLRPQKVSNDRRTERGDFLDYFLSKLNPDRLQKGLKAYSYGRLNGMLQGVPTGDLHAFRQACDNAESNGIPWGAIFHSRLKYKPEETK